MQLEKVEAMGLINARNKQKLSEGREEKRVVGEKERQTLFK